MVIKPRQMVAQHRRMGKGKKRIKLIGSLLPLKKSKFVLNFISMFPPFSVVVQLSCTIAIWYLLIAYHKLHRPTGRPFDLIEMGNSIFQALIKSSYQPVHCLPRKQASKIRCNISVLFVYRHNGMCKSLDFIFVSRAL